MAQPGTLQALIRGLQRFSRDMDQAMTRAVEQSARDLVAAMETLTSMTDHSLADLARLGHPYGTHEPPNRPHSDWRVHHQSGDLQGGLGYRMNITQLIEADIHSTAPHTWYLLLGTRYMRPRDFVSAALIRTQPRIANNFLEAHRMVHEIHQGKRFKTEMTLIPHEDIPAQLPRR